MEKKILSNKSLGLISLAVIAFGIGFFVYLLAEDAQLETSSGPPKAVIIDQLYDDFPNKMFHTKATEYLQKAGYTVDIVTKKDVTVDFYKDLPKMNYKYVVIRTHGAQNSDDVVLFTGEKYSEEQYIQEQLFGQVKKATPLLERVFPVTVDASSEWIVVNDTFRYLMQPAKRVDVAKNEYFAISANLISHGMKGKFDDTVFVLGGCNTLSNPSLAKSLTERGASMVLGWDEEVGSQNNDNAILFFLEKTLIDNIEVDQVLNDFAKQYPPESMPFPATFTSFTQLFALKQ